MKMPISILTGQLASESRTGYSASYTYDGNGNRLTKTLNGTTDNYSYDDGDKLLDIKVSGVAVKTFSYDAAGRTTQIATSAYTRNFSYDYEGRISQITGLPTTNTFTYNGFDTRTKKVDSAGTANFKRLGAGVTAPVVDDGAATYTPGVSERRSGTTTYMHAGLKTLDQRTNSSQANTGTKRYDAFGNVVSSTGSWASPWGYAGKFGYQSGEDAEIMLLGHRYYDASTGRFLTRDPIRDGRNWYSYCSNSPLGQADPAGLSGDNLEAWLKGLELCGVLMQHAGAPVPDDIPIRPIPPSFQNPIETRPPLEGIGGGGLPPSKPPIVPSWGLLIDPDTGMIVVPRPQSLGTRMLPAMRAVFADTEFRSSGGGLGSITTMVIAADALYQGAAEVIKYRWKIEAEYKDAWGAD